MSIQPLYGIVTLALVSVTDRGGTLVPYAEKGGKQ